MSGRTRNSSASFSQASSKWNSARKALLAERMRAGGASIPGFYTKTGVGTQVAEGKEVKTFDGEDYILERGIFADLAIVKAWKADETGNLVFRKTARNFNQPAATCGKVCVVEVEEVVPAGSLDPDCIHLPGVYVQRMIVGTPYDKKIEFVTTRETGGPRDAHRDLPPCSPHWFLPDAQTTQAAAPEAPVSDPLTRRGCTREKHAMAIRLGRGRWRFDPGMAWRSQITRLPAARERRVPQSVADGYQAAKSPPPQSCALDDGTGSSRSL